MNLLFATSELFPLIKTGGLADVSRSLPEALQRAGVNVDLILPGYRSVRTQLPAPSASYRFTDAFIPRSMVLLEYQLPASGLRLLLLDCAELFDRDGGPYGNQSGQDWPDNPRRFGLFCRAIVALLAGRCTLKMRYDVVHCNDWQTGLVPALARHESLPVTSVMTIHNMAYQGVYSRGEFDGLYLPDEWWSYDKLEFYGSFSFLKAGIVFAHQVTTVSPTYAHEILEEPLACGMSGLLHYHRRKLSGILNGADYDIWNPATDSLIRFHYDSDTLAEKRHNKQDLQRSLGLQLTESVPMIGLVGRLVSQKGIDWVADVMEKMSHDAVQWVILGSGERALENRLLALASSRPRQVSVTLRYDETLAHRIEAGSDLFVMPSRYEPCGLNQIYSLRYGTLPIVRATGGLADTVVDTNPDTLNNGTATGFSYQGDRTHDLEQCIRRAIGYFSDKGTWRTVQLTAMAQRFDWHISAQQYIQLYRNAL